MIRFYLNELKCMFWYRLYAKFETGDIIHFYCLVGCEKNRNSCGIRIRKICVLVLYVNILYHKSSFL